MINTMILIIWKYYNNELELLCQKGYYPYEWVNDVQKLNHIGLPPSNDFYSSLTQETISEKNYQHARNVYNKLNSNSFKDYHMTYLKTDVLLLADVFETLEILVIVTMGWILLITFLLHLLLGILC